jgi:23S rRNA pseudouridine2605 synthase
MVDHSYDPNAADQSGQAAPNAEGERVAKALARAGVASRREVERLIAAGRVSLNGEVLDTPAVKIGPGDVLKVDGKVVGEPEPVRVWRYHKPAGLMTTHNDPKGRPTVFEHLPPGLPRVISIGRLDLNSEGLLLLTNDGALARALELPANGLVRRYRARARGHTTQAKLDRLMDGLTVDGVRYGPIEARLDKAKEGGTGANLWITVTLSEGKNREVRRVLEALDLTVNRLIRQSYGPFQLGALVAGEAEEIGPRVIREQLGRYIDAASLPTGSHTPALAASTLADDPSGNRQTARGQTGRGPLVEGAAKKTEYKPGWAKPKKRVGPPRAKTPVRAKAPPREKAPSREKTPARAKGPPRARSAEAAPKGAARRVRSAKAGAPKKPRS